MESKDSISAHLEGILSDFEALQRSFDDDDPGAPVPTLPARVVLPRGPLASLARWKQSPTSSLSSSMHASPLSATGAYRPNAAQAGVNVGTGGVRQGSIGFGIGSKPSAKGVGIGRAPWSAGGVQRSASCIGRGIFHPETAEWGSSAATSINRSASFQGPIASLRPSGVDGRSRPTVSSVGPAMPPPFPIPGQVLSSQGTAAEGKKEGKIQPASTNHRPMVVTQKMEVGTMHVPGGIPFEEHSPRMSRSSVSWTNTDILPAAAYCEDHARNESTEGRNGIKCVAPVFPQAGLSFMDVHPQAGMGVPTKGLQSDSRIVFMQENNHNAVPGDKIEHHVELSQVKGNPPPNALSIELSNGQGLKRGLCKDHEEGIPDVVHSTFDSRGLRRDSEFESKEGNVETIAASPVSSLSLNHSLPGPGKLIDGKGGPRSIELFGYVGIDAALEQLQRKAMKEGLEFNIMIVGQSGLGKSTLMNTLFKGQVSCRSSIPPGPSEPKKTIEIQTVSHVIEERGVRMKLTVIDTPGFGDQIDNGGCWEPIIRYIGEQYERYLLEEMQVKRKRRIPDSRVHCCVYCIPSTGHTLRPLDVACLRRLSAVVNVVPVMAKADSLTLEERAAFRTRIQADLAANNIDVYPQHIFDESEEERIANDVIREKIPFAVVGSDQEHQVNGKKLLGRKTIWGIVEVENMSHCEFADFRDLLIRSHMQDLKDVTHRLLYESFRERRLSAAQVVSPSQPRPPTNGLSEPGTPMQAAS
uniref:uncharacterized protein isoform X1 n=2 Tax=Myxine glutinosa TaxID=7769 RepID=UPI00358FCA4F